MRLIIGGYAQGKLDYALKDYSLENSMICEGTIPEGKIGQGKTVILNHLHNWVKASILLGENPEEEILEFLKDCPDCIIICDEIGNGIIPMDSFEREYRERIGRLLVELAGRAEKVERVICGIGQKIK